MIVAAVRDDGGNGEWGEGRRTIASCMPKTKLEPPTRLAACDSYMRSTAVRELAVPVDRSYGAKRQRGIF